MLSRFLSPGGRQQIRIVLISDNVSEGKLTDNSSSPIFLPAEGNYLGYYVGNITYNYLRHACCENCKPPFSHESYIIRSPLFYDPPRTSVALLDEVELP